MPEDRAKKPEARIIDVQRQKGKGKERNGVKETCGIQTKLSNSTYNWRPRQGRDNEWAEAILEEIMSEKCSKLVEDISQIQDAQ